jgi:hypothetical protein
MLESLTQLLTPLTLAAAAVAQTSSSIPAEAIVAAPADEIVVEAGRERAQVYRRMLGRARLQGFLPRWQMPLCLFQSGISDKSARDRFAARVHKVAREVGAPVAAAGCDSNVVVAWSSDGSNLAQGIYRKRPRILTNVVFDAKDAFLNGDAAVRWVPRADFGPGMGSGGEAGISVAGQAGPAINAPVYRGEGASLIKEHVSAGISSVLVIIDVDRAAGVSLDALADHIAMLVLSGIPMGSSAGQLGGDESILNLFEDSANRTMAGLTAADREYLITLYKLNPNQPEWKQRAKLASAVTRALEEDEAALAAE